MSDEKNFFARWSRRKHDADPETTRQSKPENCGDVLVSKLPIASLTQASPFDAASLPAMNSIGPGSDIRCISRSRRAADLTRAALRRVWLTDPAIRDFVGLSENSWDFNAPGAIPGFGSIDAESVANMVTRLLGGPDAIATDESSCSKRLTQMKILSARAHRLKASRLTYHQGYKILARCGWQNRLSLTPTKWHRKTRSRRPGIPARAREQESKSRRNHGGALPQLP